jgi:nicotinamidase-related amidase
MSLPATFRCPASLYQQFDADVTRDVPGEAYGGWRDVELDLATVHTAVVVMHAWYCGEPGQYPGWERAVEYHGRARRITREIMPGLLQAVRSSPLPLFHVVGGGVDYYSHLPGHQRACALAGPEARATPPQIEVDPVGAALRARRRAEGFPGAHNLPDIQQGFPRLDFSPEVRPRDDEGIAENGAQLLALCRHHGINHLIYTGFALNWCLLMSPGGMVDMERHGLLCSTVAEAVTCVENATTAREEREKAQALWRVSVGFGYVFHLDPLLAALPRLSA